MKRLLLASLVLAACAAPDDGTVDRATTLPAIDHVFVIAMENHDAAEIYGSADAPYINGTLLAAGAHATFTDELAASVPSEPHYVWMEAGTNVFADHTFGSDLPPGWFWNTTASTAHLSAQLEAAGRSWMSYQEGINSLTGACPVSDWWWYAAKHDPFVFFQDVSGASPSKTNAHCAAHHEDLSKLANDLANDAVADYVFITPNLCHDMHGALFCPDGNAVHAGDTWLHDNLPAILAYANANHGLVMITWDEGDHTQTMPFVALGPDVEPGYTSTQSFTHSSQVKTIDELFGLPTLATVQSSNDLADLFY